MSYRETHWGQRNNNHHHLFLLLHIHNHDQSHRSNFAGVGHNRNNFNFNRCLSYALTIYTNIQQLLFKGGHQCNKPLRVQELYIYPIKSCGEISLSNAKVTPIGFEHDRILQVVTKVDKKDSPD